MHRLLASPIITVVLSLTSLVSAACVANAQENNSRPESTATNQSDRSEMLWYGELDAGPRLFRFLITVSRGEPDKVEATLLSLDEGDAKFALKNVAMDESSFSFAIPSTGAKYEGSLNDSKDQVQGTWAQRGAKLPLNWRRVKSKPAETATEIWSGTIQAGLQKLVMQFRIYTDALGKKTAFVDSVSQKVGGLKADVKMDGDNVSLSIAALKAKFDGKKDTNGTELNGKWTQGIAIDLKMKRVEVPTTANEVELRRPQTPKPPYPYETKDVVIKNATADVELSGTLTYPKSDKPLPVAILITGSGPQDRDETLLGHKPFAVLADYLSRNGIAVLRYDDRGVGKSTGNFSNSTSQDFASDVEAAIDYLKTDSIVDAKQIGLIGHSEGGLIAPGVASKRSDVAWIVLMAGTGVNGREIMYSQGQLIIEANGGDGKALRTQRTLQEVAFAQVSALTAGADVSGLIEQSTTEVVDRMTKDGDAPPENELGSFKKDMREAMQALLATVNTPWFRYFLTYEPGPALEKTTCPVLAVVGERDLQVDPKLNLPKIEEALKRGGNTDVQIKTLSGLNHLFQTCTTGSPTEYEGIDETLSPTFLELVKDWVLAHSK